MIVINQNINILLIRSQSHEDSSPLRYITSNEALFIILGPLVVRLLKEGDTIQLCEDSNHSEETIIISQPLSKAFFGHANDDTEEHLDFESLFKVPANEVPKESLSLENLEIVNNFNEKVIIKVPTRPNSVTFQQLDLKCQPSIDELFKAIPNPFDRQARDKEFTEQGFRLNYQSGYAPAEIQTKHKDPEDFQKKPHFIRQKQSQANLNLKRNCGVSYVKKSESEQKNVNNIFKKLPPLVFQCSSGCQNTDMDFQELYQTLLNGKQILVCSMFPCQDEAVMREYLLNPHSRNQDKMFLVRGFIHLWMLFQDGVCLVIHLKYDSNQLVSTIDLDETGDVPQQLVDFAIQSQIQICLLMKKSVSGRKAFLKSVGLWNEEPAKETLIHKEDQDVISTKVVLPNFLLDSAPTAESIFERFSQMISQSQKNPTPKIIDTIKKPTKKIQKGQAKDAKKMRSRQQECSDIRNDRGASDDLISFLTKEDGYNNIGTCSIRMEMYVDEDQWLGADLHNRDLLNSFIKCAEHNITQNLLIKMMNKRFKAFSKGIDYIMKYASKIKQVDTSQVKPVEIQKQLPWTQELKSIEIAKKNQKLTQNYSSVQMKLKDLSFLQQPLYCITTRDSFAFDLKTKVSIVEFGGRKVKKTEYFFDPDNCPANFKGTFLKMFPNYEVGCHSYEDYFTHEELLEIEANVYKTELKAFEGHYLPMTAQISFASSNQQTSVRRTKFFFGYRYMWTKCQLAEPHSMVAAGVRRDVSSSPTWMNNLISQLENDKLVPKDFINSIACNVYHDGKEGLAQHFDDAVRFRQPIYTIRIFSDCRLSFGSQFYGFCNGAFAVPLPRGCILVMEEASYAANAIKHCVRPCDMTGKSAALILRQMHSQVTDEAVRYDTNVDLPCHFSSLSINENAIPYGEQRRLEAEVLMNVK